MMSTALRENAFVRKINAAHRMATGEHDLSMWMKAGKRRDTVSTVDNKTTTGS